MRLKNSIKVFVGIPQLSHDDHYKSYLASVLTCIDRQETGATIMKPYVTPPYAGTYQLGNTDRLEAIVDRLNNVVTKFTQSDATHLYINDGDVETPSYGIDTLLRHNVDVASGVYPFHDWDAKPLMVFGRMGTHDNPCGNFIPRVWEHMKGQIFGEEYPMSGANGCLLVKKRVFKTLHPKLPPLRFARENNCGCDTLFWKKIQDAGFTARVDTNVICGHLPKWPLADVDKWCHGITPTEA